MHHSREIELSETFDFDYSICTLVTDPDEYREMVESFINAGFNTEDTEYLYVDNSLGNKLDAYSALNKFLRQARGEYVILCHQDVLLHFDNRAKLEACIQELNTADPQWAICGNAGAAGPNHIVYRISYPDGQSQSKGNFPVRVQSVDENFIVVKNAAGISLSANLRGFHLYGADICLRGELKGYTSYVIDFNLLHKSRGKKDAAFDTCRRDILKKYNKAFRPRWIQTTSTRFYLSGSSVGRIAGNGLFLFFIRMWNGLTKRLHK